MGSQAETDIFYGVIIPMDTWTYMEVEQYELEAKNTDIHIGCFGDWTYGDLEYFVCIKQSLQSGYEGVINTATDADWEGIINDWLITKEITELDIGWKWTTSFR